jgi:uncharacterized damage-inducible protein DinB
MSHRKEAFLKVYDREHATTLRVLNAYPKDKTDLRPHPKSKTALELAWVFVLERGLGMKVWNDEIAKGTQSGKLPGVPESWDEVIAAYEKAHQEFRSVIAAASEDDLSEIVHFYVAPKTMGDWSRHDWIWFLLHDEIHHRGQLSIYLRMADGKVPAIYGGSADEPWV